MSANPARGVSYAVILATSSAALAQTPARHAVIRFTGRSEHGRVFVVDEEGLRYLRFGSPEGDDQTVIDPANPKAVPVEYVRAAGLGLLTCGRCQRLLMIGLGGGSFTGLARRLYPLMTIDAVEIDPLVVEVAERFFGVRTDERFQIHVGDGAAFVQTIEQPYDLVLLDAYTDVDAPPTLITETFFRRVASRLTPGGVVMLNLSMDEDLEQLVRERFTAVFAHTACLRTADECNLMMFGSAAPLPAADDLQREALRFGRDHDLGFNLETAARRWRAGCP